MLFGKKKEKKIEQEVQEIKLPTLEEINKEVAGTQQAMEKAEIAPLQLIEEKKVELGEEPALVLPEKKIEPERKIKIEELRKVAPLFIKLEKYEEVLNTMADVKSVLNLLKDSFSVLDENERIRTETVETIRENIKRMEGKIASLDSVLLRPPGHEETREKEFKAEEVKDTLSTLKSQIDKLRQELQSIE
jgi:superfamily II helicase